MKKLIHILLAAIVAVMFCGLTASAQTSNCDRSDQRCLIDGYTKQIAAAPGDIENYYSRARAYQDSRDYVSAIKDFSTYIDMKPAKPEYKADAYTASGDSYRAL